MAQRTLSDRNMKSQWDKSESLRQLKMFDEMNTKTDMGFYVNLIQSFYVKSTWDVEYSVFLRDELNYVYYIQKPEAIHVVFICI